MKYRKLIITSTIFVCIILFLIPNVVKANYSDNMGEINNFYIKTLYFSMPVMKVMDNKNKDMPYEGTFNDKLLYMMGINIKDPLSIIKKEIAFMYEGEMEKEGLFEMNTNADGFITPFKINDKEVSLENSDNQNDDNTKNEIDNHDGDNLTNHEYAIYNPKIKKTLNKTKPQVLIYHTHTHESYKPGVKTSDGNSLTVCEVGEELKKELEVNYGVCVIHDTTSHDLDYNNSYKHSADTLNKYLKQYKDFPLIIDIHRDAGGNTKSTIVKMNNENVARIMFVTAKNNPRYEKNLAVVKKLMTISNDLFPQYCKAIYTYPRGTNAFNQNKSTNCILIEVGSNIITIDEAKNSSKYMARIIAEYINGK